MHIHKTKERVKECLNLKKLCKIFLQKKRGTICLINRANWHDRLARLLIAVTARNLGY